jgi:hypothetical protein
LDAKAPLASPTFTGTVAGITKAMVGLGSVDNTADASKPVSTAQAAADAVVQVYAVQRANHTGTQSVGTITGLGGAATLSVGTAAGTVASGDDSRITGALSTATAATTYQPLDSDLTAIAALTTTTFGRSLLTQADAAASRTTIGLGSLATQSGTFSGTSSGTNTGDQTFALTGDVTGSGTGSFAATLSASGVTAGTYASVTVDAKGRVTGGTATQAWSTITSTPTTLAGYGITDAATSTHVHGNLTNAGAIGSTSGLPVITTTSGVLTVGAFGTSAGQFCVGNDSRLSDARTPTAHTQAATTISVAGPFYSFFPTTMFVEDSLTAIDGVLANKADSAPATTATLGQIRVGTGLAVTSGTVSVSYGTSSSTACVGNDARLSDARTPTSHTHGNITNSGAIGSSSGQIVVTTTSGVLTTAATISASAVTGLAAVATSGAYADLSGRPTIPNITSGTAAPSGGTSGDIYLRYSP